MAFWVKKKWSVFFLSGSKMMTGPFALCRLRQIEECRKSGGCCKKKPQMEGEKKGAEWQSLRNWTFGFLFLFYWRLAAKHYTALCNSSWTALLFFFMHILHHSKFNHFFLNNFIPMIELTGCASACLQPHSKAATLKLHLQESRITNCAVNNFPLRLLLPSSMLFPSCLPMSRNPRRKT